MRISYSSWSLFTFLGMPGGSLGLSVTHLEAQQQAQHHLLAHRGLWAPTVSKRLASSSTGTCVLHGAWPLLWLTFTCDLGDRSA